MKLEKILTEKFSKKSGYVHSKLITEHIPDKYSPVKNTGQGDNYNPMESIDNFQTFFARHIEAGKTRHSIFRSLLDADLFVFNVIMNETLSRIAEYTAEVSYKPITLETVYRGYAQIDRGSLFRKCYGKKKCIATELNMAKELRNL